MTEEEKKAIEMFKKIEFDEIEWIYDGETRRIKLNKSRQYEINNN